MLCNHSNRIYQLTRDAVDDMVSSIALLKLVRIIEILKAC